MTGYYAGFDSLRRGDMTEIAAESDPLQAMNVAGRSYVDTSWITNKVELATNPSLSAVFLKYANV